LKRHFLKLIIFFKTLLEIYNWYIPILHYFGCRKKEDVIRFRNGTKCILRNKSDATAFFEIFFLKMYTRTNDFFIKQDDIIIDIGAHVGFFTIYASKKAYKGKVFSFEPASTSFNLLQKNVKMNKLSNVITQNYAVLKKSGNATLFVDKSDELANNVFKKDPSLIKEDVTVISLQDIFSKYQIKKVDLLKLDCEGAEYEIILNLPKDILKKIVKISAEIHPDIENYSVDMILKFLIANNFKVDYNHSMYNIPNMGMLYASNKEFFKN